MKQVGQLLSESGQFLELGFALLRERDLQGRRQKGAPITFAGGTVGGRRSPAFGGLDGDREHPLAVNLKEGGRAIGNVQHALNYFTTSPTGLVRKLRHKLTVPLI